MLRANPLLGYVGAGWALENLTFSWPKWHLPNSSMPFHRTQKVLISRAQPPPTCLHLKHYIWGCINHRFINIQRTKQQLKATKLLKIISLKSLFSSNREVEKKDVTRVLEIHIFITQFFHKFDLRTTMLVRTYLTKIIRRRKMEWSYFYFQFWGVARFMSTQY